MMTLITAIASGIFALIGGYVGARLTRQTEYEKWLRQERSTAFAHFLRQMHDVHERARNAIYETELPDIERDIKVTELFVGLNAHEMVVRLYLNPSDRERFSKLVNELWVVHSPVVKQPERIRRSKEILSEVQAIFENTLHDKQVTKADKK